MGLLEEIQALTERLTGLTERLDRMEGYAEREEGGIGPAADLADCGCAARIAPPIVALNDEAPDDDDTDGHTPRLYSAGETASTPMHPLPWSSRWRPLMEDAEQGYVMAVWGGEGSGKSNFAAQLAKESSAWGPVIIASAEEGIGTGGMVKRLQLARLQAGDDVWVTNDTYPLQNLEEIVRMRGAKTLILDSLNYLLQQPDGDAHTLSRMSERLPGVSIIWIMHADKEKRTYKGSSLFVHHSNIVVEVRKDPGGRGAVATATKNRYSRGRGLGSYTIFR